MNTFRAQRLFLLQINRAGIRGAPFATDQAVRILAVGGSSTECLYLDEDLAHLVPGYPRIDIVVVMVGVNDLHRRLMYGEREPKLPDVRVPLVRESDPPAEHDALMWIGGQGAFIESGQSDHYYTPGALADGMRRYNERLAGVAGERGVECLDLAGVLPRDTSVFYDDVHFNENGARLVARKLADYFIANPAAPDAVPAASAVRAGPEDFPVVEDLVEIRRWGPKSATVGTPFNEQPGGRSSLWIGMVGQLTAGQFVFVAGQLLPTVRTPGLASAAVPADLAARLVGQAADHPVWIVDLDTGRRQLVGELAVR